MSDSLLRAVRAEPVRDSDGGLDRRLSALVHALGWRRLLVLRRVAAGALAVTALVLAIRAPATDGGGVPVLVAARALGSGSVVHPEDVVVRRWPAEVAPVGALRRPEEADGQVLAGATGPGEPLTTARLAGTDPAGSGDAGRGMAGVPVRLADAGVAGLLRPGRAVDVVSVGPHADQPTLLAAGAIVLTVLPAESPPVGGGRLVLIAVPRAVAGRVAAATLGQEVAITLR